MNMFLTARQISAVAVCPDQIVAASHFFASRLHQKGIADVEIRAVALVSLNGRKPQLMIKPELDLTTVHRTWGHQSWIIPLTEPLTDTPWDINSDDWPQTLGIKLPVSQSLPGQR